MKKKTIAMISVAALAATTIALPAAAAGSADNPVQIAGCGACGAKKCGACGAKKCGACGAKKCGACGAKKCGACGAKKCGACGAKKCGAK